MADNMLKFVKIGQQTPPKREVLERKEDFKEIYKELLTKRLKNNLVDVLNVEFHFVRFIAL